MLYKAAHYAVDAGSYLAAQEMARSAFEAERGCLGEEHPITLRRANLLGNIYQCLGKYQDAEETLREVLEKRRY